MNIEQRAIRFSCHDSMLYGVLSIPEQVSARGVLIVVGGPQYRTGSHRQFALMARFLATQGIAVMRFDYRGMGDSEGESRSFESIDDDIRHAIDQFHVQVQGLREVVIWGLCDAASAALFYAHRDPRVTGLVLLNPWIRTEIGAAKTYLRHYYLQRLLDREFWFKVLRLRFDIRSSTRSFFRLLATALPLKSATPSPSGMDDIGRFSAGSLPDRMLAGLERFQGKVLFILSGNDLTAKEFSDHAAASHGWSKRLSSPKVQVRHLADANHTFAREAWRNEVAKFTKDWINSW